MSSDFRLVVVKAKVPMWTRNKIVTNAKRRVQVILPEDAGKRVRWSGQRVAVGQYAYYGFGRSIFDKGNSACLARLKHVKVPKTDR